MNLRHTIRQSPNGDRYVIVWDADGGGSVSVYVDEFAYSTPELVAQLAMRVVEELRRKLVAAERVAVEIKELFPATAGTLAEGV